MNRHRTKIPKQKKQNYRFLIPDKVLFQKMSKPEIRALSLLNEILQVSKVCTVNEGIISADYDEVVSIHLDIQSTIESDLSTPDSIYRTSRHLMVKVSNKTNPDRPWLNVCIIHEREELPIVDSVVSFVLMVESGFCEMPSTLIQGIENVRLSVVELQKKKELESRRLYERRQREEEQKRLELEQKRALDFDFECEKTRINSLTWKQLLDEHYRETRISNKLEQLVYEYRIEILGGLE